MVFVGCRNTGRKAGDKTRVGTSLPTNSDATLEQKFKSVTCLNPGEFLLPELIYEASVSKIVTFQQPGQAPPGAFPVHGQRPMLIQQGNF